MSSELRTILTPELLDELSEAYIPIGKREHIEDFGSVIKKALFSSDSNLSSFQEKIWPALKIISRCGLENLPDWFALLPPVEHSTFPSQAFGLQLVLDQAPRILFTGIDLRWTSGYFDEVAVKFAMSLQSLAPHLRPSSWERWQDSVTFEYWLLLRLFYGAPIVHNEKTADAAVSFTEETRKLIEQRFNIQDPIRHQPEKRWELLGFPRLLKSGPPLESCDVPTGGFWIQLLMDVHKPPLDKFGRYPYRNWVLGRSMTPGEDEWLRQAEIFGPPSKEVIDKINADIAKGVWSPLGSGSPGAIDI